MRTLQHQTALIICSAAGLGPAIAERYAALGAQVILHTEKDQEHIRQVISNIKAMGVKVTSLSAEPGSGNGPAELFESISSQFKKINIIVIDHQQADLPELLKQATRNISDRGRIIHLTSTEAAKLEKTLALISQLALEFATRNITINTIIIPPAGQELFNRDTEAVDVADAAEFFASDLSGLISGQHLMINGARNT
jgi:3-oxoacyl-[acyl-carrier protein] reductase